MNNPVKFATSAIREIRQARAHYRKIRLSLLIRFVGEIDDAIAAMVDRPHSFSEHLHGTRRVLLKKSPYMVVFQDFADHFFRRNRKSSSKAGLLEAKDEMIQWRHDELY
jgi:hypothetical protein